MACPSPPADGPNDFRVVEPAPDRAGGARMTDLIGRRVRVESVGLRALRGANAEQAYEALLDRAQVPERDPAVADLHEPPGPDPAAAVQDPDYAPRADVAVWRRWDAWPRAAAQQCRAAGTLPGWLEARIAAAGPPSVPWQRYLQRFIQQVRGGGTQWLPPSRRHWGRGLYLPSQRMQRLDLAVAVDTSGSTVEDWPQFRAELGGILRACDDYRLRLLQYDTRVTDDPIYTPSQPLPKALPITGVGGTDLRAPFEHLADEPPTTMVVVTDGHGPTPEQAPAYPVLWALTPGRSQVPGWGRVLWMMGDRSSEGFMDRVSKRHGGKRSVPRGTATRERVRYSEDRYWPLAGRDVDGRAMQSSNVS